MIIVLIPFYNYANELLKCLESIKSQNMKDYNIILWDDGSNENEIKILRNWLLKNNNKKNKNSFKYIYIRNNNNEGVGYTKYNSLKYIQTNFDDDDIVIIIDGDDYLCRNDIFTNLSELYKDNGIMWTVGGLNGTDNFEYERLNMKKIKLSSLNIPPLRSFRKKVLNNYIFSNFFMGDKFIVKTSDKIMMAPIINNFPKNGVLIKQKIYEYKRTESSLTYVEKIKEKNIYKYKDILRSRNHYLRNMIFCKNLRENIFYNNLKDKKILLIGNRPLEKKLGNIINNYDIVIRFNFSFNGNQDENSGDKLSYLFINNGLCKYLNGKKYSKLSFFEESKINNFKEWVENNKDKIIARYYYSNQNEFDELNNNYILLQSISDTSLNDKLNFFYGILEKYKIKFDRKEIETEICGDKHFSLGLVMINWLLMRGLKCDICGFSKNIDNEYYISYANLRKKKDENVDMKLINNHNIFLEWKIRYFYKINKLIRIIDE